MWRTPEERSRVAGIAGRAYAKSRTKEEHREAALAMNKARWGKVERAEAWLVKRVGPKEVELGEMSERVFDRMPGEECS